MTLIDHATASEVAVAPVRSIGGEARLRLVSDDEHERRLMLLRDAVGVLASTMPDDFDAEGSLEVAREIERVARAAEAALIRCVRTWQDRGDPVQTPDTTEEELAWRASDAARKALMVDLGRSRGEATRLIATVKALRRDPGTEVRLRAGEISGPQARIIAETVTALVNQPEEVVNATREAMVADAVVGGTERVRKRADEVAHRLAPGAVLARARAAEERRRFFLTPALDGYVPRGFLPTVGAEALITVLDSLADRSQLYQDDGLAKARADALVRLAEDRLRSGELPERHNGPTAVTVVMRADTALGLPGAPPARTGRGQMLPTAEAHLLVCEAALRGVLVDGEGEILWQGRRRRYATRAQYEALAVRDGGCTVERCSLPASQCDAHHDVPWTAGGHTNVNEMRLLCRRHHREVHDELWWRQYGWQEARVNAGGEKSEGGEGRSGPWYVDTPAWYPGPSPWHPDGEREEKAA
jgi:hypothetical protein